MDVLPRIGEWISNTVNRRNRILVVDSTPALACDRSDVQEVETPRNIELAGIADVLKARARAMNRSRAAAYLEAIIFA